MRVRADAAAKVNKQKTQSQYKPFRRTETQRQKHDSSTQELEYNRKGKQPMVSALHEHIMDVNQMQIAVSFNN
jgi:hypothetical protein